MELKLSMPNKVTWPLTALLLLGASACSGNASINSISAKTTTSAKIPVTGTQTGSSLVTDSATNTETQTTVSTQGAVTPTPASTTNTQVQVTATVTPTSEAQDQTHPSAADIVLLNMPASSSSDTALNVTVSGSDVVEYKFVLKTTGLACVFSDFDSRTWTVIATPITEALGADDNKRLCVIAKDSAGNQTPANAPKEYTWVKDTTKPLASEVTLSNTPADPSNGTGNLNITVGGTGIIAYQFAYTTSATECTSASYNGSWILVATNITEAIGADANKKRLCVIGKDAAGNEMLSNSGTAKSYDWKQDTVKPLAADISLTGAPADPSNGTGNFDVTVGGTDIASYKYAYTTSSTACTAATYSGTWKEVTTHITEAIGADADKKRLCVIAKDLAGNEMLVTDVAQSHEWTQDTTAPSNSDITLSGHPTGSSTTTSLDIAVGGTGVSSYQYKFDTSDTCSTDSNYSSSILVATHITESIANNTTYPNNSSIYLCVKGVDALGNVTMAANAKKVNWTKSVHFVSLLSPSLWLRADSGVTKDGNDKVSSWNDGALTNHATQVALGKQPTWISSAVNGQPTVRFDGVDDFVSIANHSSLNTTGLHFFMVYQLESAANKVVMEKGGNAAFMLQPAGASGSMFYYSTSGSQRTIGTYHGPDFGIIEFSYDTSRKAIYLNGNLADSLAVTAVANNSSPLVLGARSDGTVGADIDISEVILFGDELSVSARHKVLGYLAAKYDINAIPSGNQSLWLRADKGLYSTTDCSTTVATSNGDSVACWKDQSSSGNNVTQATASKQPIVTLSGLNSIPNLSFDGTDDFLSGNFSQTSTDIFTVARRNAATSNSGSKMIFNDVSSGGIYTGFGSLNGTPYIHEHALGVTSSGPTQSFVDGIGHLLSVTMGATRFKTFLNGVILNSYIPPASRTSPSTHVVGGYGNNTDIWDGDISEIIKYTSELTAHDRNRVESYLGQKYEITQTSSSVLDTSGLNFWLKADSGITTADNAAQFTAANTESLSVASNSNLSTGDIDFSVAGWVYLDTSTTQDVVTKWNGNADANSEFSLINYPSGGGMGFWVLNGSGGGNVMASNAGVLDTGKWHFVVAWHDSVNNVIGIQVNNGTPNTVSHTTGLYLGNAAFKFGTREIDIYPFNGRMAKFGFWKKVLSTEEKTALYNAGKGLSYSGLTSGLKTNLQGYWNLDETSGTRNDSHGSNHLADNNTVTQAAGPGSHISSWADQSGKGFNASVSPGATKPVWIADSGAALSNKPALRFNDTNVSMKLADNVIGSTSEFTFISVAKPISNLPTTSYVAFFGSLYSNYGSTYFTNTLLGGGVLSGGNAAGGSLAMQDGSAKITSLRYESGQSVKFFVNGTGNIGQQSAASVPALPINVFYIGSEWDGGGGSYASSWKGDISELIFIKKAISDVQREAIECYLSSKYNITLSGVSCN